MKCDNLRLSVEYGPKHKVIDNVGMIAVVDDKIVIGYKGGAKMKALDPDDIWDITTIQDVVEL